MPAWLVLLIMVYVVTDIASPQMPGAVVFDPTECVEARQSGSFWAIDDVMPVDSMPARPLPISVIDRFTHPVIGVRWRPASPIVHVPALLRPPRSRDDDPSDPERAALI
jgi:hypothetical protein